MTGTESAAITAAVTPADPLVRARRHGRAPHIPQTPSPAPTHPYTQAEFQCANESAAARDASSMISIARTAAQNSTPRVFPITRRAMPALPQKTAASHAAKASPAAATLTPSLEGGRGSGTARLLQSR